MLKDRVVLAAAVIAACLIAPTAAVAVPPVITITSPVDGAEFVVGETPAAQFSCSDAPEGTTSCDATVDGNAIFTSDPLPMTLGEHELTVTAVDDNDPPASNTTVATRTYFVATNRCEDIDAGVARDGEVRVQPACEADPTSVTFDPPGAATFDAVNNEIVYTAGDTPGPVSFEYTGDDAQLKEVLIEGPCAEAAAYPLGVPIEQPVALDCGTLDANESIEVVPGFEPEHGTLGVFGEDSVTYLPDPGYTGPDSFRFRVNDGVNPPSIPASATVTVVPVPPGGGTGDDGGSSDGGGGGSGLVPDQPEPPAQGLPPLPFLPSLITGGSGSNGNIPTAFGTKTGVELRGESVRANRRGLFTLRLQNDNRFWVTGSLVVTGAFKKNRKGRRVPQLRVRNEELALAGGDTTEITLGLSRKARRLLAERGKLTVVVQLRVQDVEGERRTVRERITLRAPKPKG